jgi:hypothetical protein
MIITNYNQLHDHLYDKPLIPLTKKPNNSFHFTYRQQLQTSATKDMKFGIHQSVETLHIEAELGHIQQKAAKLAIKRSELLAEMQKWAPNTPQQHQVGFITLAHGLRTHDG